MSAGQFEVGLIVIERRGIPRRRGVARRAIVIESSRHMIRISNAVEVRRMARVTIGRSAFVLSVLMTEQAVRCGVRARERECSRAVIECRWLPGSH